MLLVDDDRADADMVKIGIKRKEIPFDLHHVDRGNKAISFLRKEGEYQDSPTPHLVLLDLKMPIVTGFDVLTEVKGDDSLSRIPIIVWTGSEHPKDISLAYSLKANSYISKPDSPNEFFNALDLIYRYWIGLSLLS